MAPIAVQRLLQRQCIDASDVTFTGHQASQRLLDAWKATLKPGAMFQTLAQYRQHDGRQHPGEPLRHAGHRRIALGGDARLGRRHACARPSA